MRFALIAISLVMLAGCKAATPITSVADVSAPASDKVFVLITVRTNTDAAGSLESGAEHGFSLTLAKLDRSGKPIEFAFSRIRPGQPYLIELPVGVYFVQKAQFRDWSETFLPQPTLFNARRGQINYAGDITIETQYTHNSVRGNSVTNWYSRHQETEENGESVNWVKKNYPELTSRYPVTFSHIYDTSETIGE